MFGNILYFSPIHSIDDKWLLEAPIPQFFLTPLVGGGVWTDWWSIMCAAFPLKVYGAEENSPADPPTHKQRFTRWLHHKVRNAIKAWLKHWQSNGRGG